MLVSSVRVENEKNGNPQALELRRRRAMRGWVVERGVPPPQKIFHLYGNGTF